MGRLIRWEPMSGISRLRDDMNRLMEDFFGETAEERMPMEAMRIPSIDVIDRENEILVRAELPGIDKNQLMIEAMPLAIQLRASSVKESEQKGENFVRRERRIGAFQRVIPLPVEINPTQVRAQYQDGVLEITLPKTELAKAKQPVKVNVE